LDESEEGAERTRAPMPHKAGYTLGFHQHEVAKEHRAKTSDGARYFYTDILEWIFSLVREEPQNLS
jgi:hypothetical protein